MHNKAELENKSLEEIQQIASEYGIKTTRKTQNELIYDIIDHESISAAQQVNEKPKKRTRIKTVDHVYSANQQKAKKIEKQTTVESKSASLFDDLSSTEKEELNSINAENNIAETEVAEPNSPEQTATAEEPAKKKRGRTKKQETETDSASKQEEAQEPIAEDAQQPATEEPAKKKRGRPKKNAVAEVTVDTESKEETSTEAEAAPAKRSLFDMINTASAPAKTEEPVKAPLNGEAFDDGSDFIILENIPSEEEEEEANNNMPGMFDRYNNMDVYEPAPNATGFEASKPQQAEEEPDYDNPMEAFDFSNIITTSGVLDVSGEFGFLRSSDYNYLPSPDDIYVNPSQIKHYGLKMGDVVEGTIRPPHEGEKFFPLVNITKINGCAPSVVRDRVPFEYLTPLFPEDKFQLCSGKNDSPSSRIVDLFSPIGKGQRALIVAQPKTGKTLLMKDIANSIARNHPEAYLMMLLIDERPEEVTDMARTVNAEVIASTFDAPADNHVKIANLVLEKAKRMVECGHDVVIFLDSITRLARAYNTVSPASGKVLTGGVDANALQKPKRFFGAARNIEGGGSLTIIATALIDTGSKMDEVIFEEFKGTGNMELQLDRSLANKRIFPAVNLIASSTRRDDLLQDDFTRRRMWIIRNHIADMTNLEAMDTILKHIERTENNTEFLSTMNG